MGGDDLAQRARPEIDRIHPPGGQHSRRDAAGEPIKSLAPEKGAKRANRRERGENAADDRQIDEWPIAEQRGKAHDAGDEAWDDPGARAIDEFPGHHSDAIDEPMRLLRRLDDLVRIVDTGK